MPETELAIYGKDVPAGTFDLAAYTKHIPAGYAMLECFHENRFSRIAEIPADTELKSNLVSARLFSKDKNIKIRRLDDHTFRIASDFEIPGFSPVWKKTLDETLSERKTHIMLWGYVNENLEDFLYEERVPFLFEYPEKSLVQNKGERLTVSVKEYLDSAGNTLWSRFSEIMKWERPDGEKKEEKAA